MDAKLLRELQDRGRFSYEGFPGAAAAEEWKRRREKTEQEHTTRTQTNADAEPKEEDALKRPAEAPR